MELPVKMIVGVVLGILVFVVSLYLLNRYAFRGVLIAYNISKSLKTGVGG